MCFLPKYRENLVKGKEKIVNLINIKRRLILRIVGLITAHSSPDIYLISLTTKIAYGYKSNYLESNKTISETGLVSIVVFPFC
jgi:hypothetical protein